MANFHETVSSPVPNWRYVQPITIKQPRETVFTETR